MRGETSRRESNKENKRLVINIQRNKTKDTGQSRHTFIPFGPEINVEISLHFHNLNSLTPFR